MGIVFILIVLIVLSAVFSGIELAFFSLSDVKIRHLVEKKVKNAKLVKKLKDKPEKLLIAILIGNNVVNIGAASLAAVVFTEAFGSSGVGIATGVMTLLVLVFGEITPKSIATVKNKEICLIVAKPLYYFIVVLTPIIIVLEGVTKLVNKFTGAKTESLVSEEELKTMAKMGVEEKSIEKYEGEMINRVFDLNDISAVDVMTVKSEMFVMDANMLMCKAIPIISNSPYSRIPIYINDTDNIVGVVYVKDVLKEGSECIVNPEGYDDKDLKLLDIARKPIFIPEQKLIKDLLKIFQKRHVQISFVVNELGDLLGVVTLEDILEELVGEIIDETDVTKELIKRLDKKNIIVEAETDIEDINDFFNVKIRGPRKDFISRYILDTTGNIPKAGEVIELDELIFTIMEASPKKIKKIKITKK